MKFIVKEKANIRTDSGWITVLPNQFVELPDSFGIHPALEKVEVVETKKEKTNFDKEVEKKLSDVKADLADDGKLNYSHDPAKKSPGRKRKSKKKE